MAEAKQEFAHFSYGVQTRIILSKDEFGHVELDTGVNYASECFTYAAPGDVYLVKVVRSAFAFGRIFEGFKISGNLVTLNTGE